MRAARPPARTHGRDEMGGPASRRRPKTRSWKAVEMSWRAFVTSLGHGAGRPVGTEGGEPGMGRRLWTSWQTGGVFDELKIRCVGLEPNVDNKYRKRDKKWKINLFRGNSARNTACRAPAYHLSTGKTVTGRTQCQRYGKKWAEGVWTIHPRWQIIIIKYERMRIATVAHTHARQHRHTHGTTRSKRHRQRGARLHTHTRSTFVPHRRELRLNALIDTHQREEQRIMRRIFKTRSPRGGGVGGFGGTDPKIGNRKRGGKVEEGRGLAGETTRNWRSRTEGWLGARTLSRPNPVGSSMTPAGGCVSNTEHLN